MPSNDECENIEKLMLGETRRITLSNLIYKVFRIDFIHSYTKTFLVYTKRLSRGSGVAIESGASSMHFSIQKKCTTLLNKFSLQKNDICDYRIKAYNTLLIITFPIKIFFKRWSPIKIMYVFFIYRKFQV